MEKSAPTRQRLLILKSEHSSVAKGLLLLKSKREALMKEFFGLVGACVEMRESLAALLSGGERRVRLVEALNGEEGLLSFAYSAKRDVSLNISVKNIWGVNVPEIEEASFTRPLLARDVSPVGERAGFFQAAGDFEAAGELLVRIASKEIKLSRIGEMIKADTRKINAITEAMLPALKGRIKAIERSLEEREREEVFRLKRFKRMREGRL
ncbi:MAG: V-type ATP synthase subunit D [Deltaproteobacteria bacterium]|nr:V-type ATP synthase subunit D [Deltaproteobacteria bacterium]